MVMLSLRWACQFHVVCLHFVCVGLPMQMLFLVEYGLDLCVVAFLFYFYISTTSLTRYVICSSSCFTRWKVSSNLNINI